MAADARPARPRVRLLSADAYHRLGRTGATGWWRAPASVLAALALLGVEAAVVFAFLPELPAERPWSDGAVLLEISSYLVALALVTPALLIAVHRVERRPAGTLSSVAGRLRRDRLRFAAGVCGAVAVPALAIGLLVERPSDWGVTLAMLGLALVLVPFQAAGEEYLFRGYLPQLAGRWVAGPWVPAVVISALFALAHGLQQDAWLFVDRLVFGLVAAWLTVRTGGIEAAIVLHAAGNLVAFPLAAAAGELDAYVAGDDESGDAWLLVDMALVGAVAYVLQRQPRSTTRVPSP